MNKALKLLLFVILIFGNHATAQRIMITVAGTGTGSPSTPVTGGTIARRSYISQPRDVCEDSYGNIYYSSYGITKISKKDGRLSYVTDGIYMAKEASGTLLIAATNYIKRYDAATGIVSIIAGTGTTGYTGDGGPATSAGISVFGIGADAGGNIYFSDEGNNVIRKISASTGIINTIAGTGVNSYTGDGGSASHATLSSPGVLCADVVGNIYFADQSQSRVRMISATSSVISTIAGVGGPATGDGGAALMAGLGHITGICANGIGNIFIDDDSCSCREISMTTGIIKRVAGDLVIESYNGDEGDALTKWFNYPYGVHVDNTNSIYVADRNNGRIRKAIQVTSNTKFAYGVGQTLNVCAGTPVSLTSDIAVVDLDGTLTWTIVAPSVHGVLVGFPASAPPGGATALGSIAATYIPDAAYLGADSFKIRVSDGVHSDTATFYTTAVVAPIVTATGPNNMCPYLVDTFHGTTTSGSIKWSSSMPTIASINSTTGVVNTTAAGGITVISGTVDNGSCAIAASNTLSVTPFPNPGIVSGAAHICVGSSTSFNSTVTGGVWSALSNHISVSATGVVTGLTPGADGVLYLVSNICGPAQSSGDITVDDCGTTGIISSELSPFTIFPNPATDKISIMKSNVYDECVIILTEVTGKTIGMVKATSGEREVSIDVSNLADGMYLLTLKGAGVSETKKIMVSK